LLFSGVLLSAGIRRSSIKAILSGLILLLTVSKADATLITDVEPNDIAPNAQNVNGKFSLDGSQTISSTIPLPIGIGPGMTHWSHIAGVMKASSAVAHLFS